MNEMLKRLAGVADTSRNRSRRTAAEIVFPDGSGLSAANDFPAGIADHDERHAGGAHYLWIEHAERRVIFQAARFGFATEGTHMNTLWHPCAECARAIVESGITSLECSVPDLDDPKYGKDFAVAAEMLQEAGVAVTYHNAGPQPAAEAGPSR